MNVSITRNINISGCGMPMMGMMPMGGYCRPAMSIFGGYCAPVMGCGMSNAMAAGLCVGALAATPGVLNAIGSGLKWGYNHILQPLWNGVIKPAGTWIYNSVLKPVWNNFLKPTFGLIGQGLKWVWDHTLGWVIKKISGKKAEKATQTEGATTQTLEESSQAA